MRLLVCVDLSESTEKMMGMAWECSATKVWLLHNAEPGPGNVSFKTDPIAAREALAERFRGEHRQIQAIAERMRNDGVDTTALLVHGETVEAILKEADDLDVDMIALGTHGHGAMYQLLMGSVSEGVLQKSKRPVLVIPTN